MLKRVKIPVPDPKIQDEILAELAQVEVSLRQELSGGQISELDNLRGVVAARKEAILRKWLVADAAGE